MSGDQLPDGPPPEVLAKLDPRSRAVIQTLDFFMRALAPANRREMAMGVHQLIQTLVRNLEVNCGADFALRVLDDVGRKMLTQPIEEFAPDKIVELSTKPDASAIH
ncbi:hypothetical protein [Chitinimonas lacunae]|uniref:Uncharacterized protein n=1 Tax=Chitinimonas lacunae TaxID=1963018 RepID=A0ABV8MZ12_9NEIS